MPHEIVTSIIEALALVTAAVVTVLLPALLVNIRKHAKRAAEQTNNGHVENLRDDVDLLIVSMHQLNGALGVENTLVRERAHRIRQRREDL